MKCSFTFKIGTVHNAAKSQWQEKQQGIVNRVKDSQNNLTPVTKLVWGFKAEIKIQICNLDKTDLNTSAFVIIHPKHRYTIKLDLTKVKQSLLTCPYVTLRCTRKEHHRWLSLCHSAVKYNQSWWIWFGNGLCKQVANLSGQVLVVWQCGMCYENSSVTENDRLPIV